MDTGTELIEALSQIGRDKGIDPEIIFAGIEQALVAACKKNYDFDAPEQEVKVIIDRDTGKIAVYVQKDVVDQPLDESIEISLENARRIHPAYALGDVCDVLVTPRNFGRIAAQTAKQIVMQKIRDAERERIYNEFKAKEHDIVTGVIMRRERRGIIIEVGKNELMLDYEEQIPGEAYITGERVKVYVVEVARTTKAPRIVISRSHPDIVRRLFEQEVPEIADGLVEIVNVSREAGSRAKVAVKSANPRVDPVGSCVGQNGYRVNAVVNELRGEKIDIVMYNDDPRMFIAAALSPSPVLAVVIDDDNHASHVVVPDRQLSLAIGRSGQNVRLAARLAGYKIDIKSESQSRQTGWVDSSEYMPQGGYSDGRYSVKVADEEYSPYAQESGALFGAAFDEVFRGGAVDGGGVDFGGLNDMERSYATFYGAETVVPVAAAEENGAVEGKEDDVPEAAGEAGKEAAADNE